MNNFYREKGQDVVGSRTVDLHASRSRAVQNWKLDTEPAEDGSPLAGKILEPNKRTVARTDCCGDHGQAASFVRRRRKHKATVKNSDNDWMDNTMGIKNDGKKKRKLAGRFRWEVSLC